MLTLTISVNTLEDLYSHIEALSKINTNAAPTQTPQTVEPASNVFVPPVLDLATVPNATFTTLASAPAVPAAAPTYTLEQIALAGAALGRDGKIEQCKALLAEYGVQTINQLRPDQYNAFVTDLRGLGAQI
jgi:hypothetical protein